MSPIDTYRDAFLSFLSQGMTHAEALEQFDETEWRKALIAELEPGMTRLLPGTHELVTNDSRALPALLALNSLADFQKRSAIDFEEQAVPLMLAGWTMETPACYQHNSKEPWRQIQTMSLYWRAPSKRPGKPGRRYLSTNQAFRAMQREANK